MTDFTALAQVAYDHAVANYATKGARFDVIVECYEIADIAKELAYAEARTEAKAKAWADEAAGLHHEVELNQAWDGPESCIGSESYDPARDPAAQPVGYDGDDYYDDNPRDLCRWVGPEFADEVSLEERWEHYAFEERNGMGYGSSF